MPPTHRNGYHDDDAWHHGNCITTDADSVGVYEFPNTLRDFSFAQLISHYPNTFAKYPNNKAEIFDISIIGSIAICKERITGRGEPFETALIFEFDKRKIVKIWFISNSSTTPRPGNEISSISSRVLCSNKRIISLCIPMFRQLKKLSDTTNYTLQ